MMQVSIGRFLLYIHPQNIHVCMRDVLCSSLVGSRIVWPCKIDCDEEGNQSYLQSPYFMVTSGLRRWGESKTMVAVRKVVTSLSTHLLRNI